MLASVSQRRLNNPQKGRTPDASVFFGCYRDAASLRNLTADFAARMGRGVDVDVVLASRQVRSLGVCQCGAAFGGARTCIRDRDGDAGVLVGFRRPMEMRGGGGT
jgi:hypothetical protein